MIDPLSAVGLASSIVQFVDFSVKITRRLSEFTEAGLEDVPKSLQTVATQLPLLLNSLERVKNSVEDDKLDFDTRCILKGVVAGCTSQVERVEKILNGVTNQAGDSLSAKARKAFKSLQAEDKLAAVEKNLQTYISVLILHHVVDDKVIVLPDSGESSIFDCPIQPVPAYEHRQDLIDQIDGFFWSVKTSQTERPVSVFLTGARRTGKAQLALGYCNQVHAAGHFKTIFWLDASSPKALSTSLQNAANSLRKNRQGSVSEKSEFIKKYLSERWHPWLLVLHGYNSKAFDYDEIYRLLPDGGGSKGPGAAYLFTVRSGEPPLKDGNIIEVPRYFNSEKQKELNANLMAALDRSDVDKALLMIEKGADKDTDERGPHYHYSAVDRAAIMGLTTVVKALLEKGANSRMRASPGGDCKNTAFEWGAENSDILQLLLDHEDATDSVWKPPFYDPALAAAAAKGNEKSVRMLLDRRPVNLDEALFTATTEGRTAMVKMLLEKKAANLTANGKDTMGCLLPVQTDSNWKHLVVTPLFDAVKAKRFETAKEILATCTTLGFPVSADSLDSALKIGSEYEPRNSPKLPDMVRALLDAGANPNAPIRHMPLHEFSKYGVAEVVALLLKRGADPWFRGRDLYLNGDTPKIALEDAVGSNRPDVVTLLLAAMFPTEGNSIDVGNSEGTEGSKSRERNLTEETKKQRQEDISRCLFIAARHGYRDVALSLLQAGADPNHHLPGRDDQTPLLEAIIIKQDPAMTRTLLKHGAHLDESNKAGQLPLNIASEKGLGGIVSVILKHITGRKGTGAVNGLGTQMGANTSDMINLKDGKGDTPLCLAASQGHEAVVKMLLDAGVDPELENKFGDTPLDLAEEKGHIEVIELLKVV